MIRVINTLGNHKELVQELRDWLIKTHPDINIIAFFSSKFVMQLGVYLQFFEYKNYYILTTPNSYAIDNVNPFLDEKTHAKALENLRNNNNTFVIAKFDLNVNDLLLVYEMAILDIIKLLTNPPF